MVKVVAFDVFGTVIDMSSVAKDDLRSYARHVREEQWEPLFLPSYWTTLPAHPDSADGIRMVREKGYYCVTCSNAPAGFLAKLSRHNGIQWDAIVPLELNRVYKPKPESYLTVCQVMGCNPRDVMMVTANKDFGDIEGSLAVGMTPFLLERDKGKTILDFANGLLVESI